MEVVGESHYLDALTAITGRRGREHIRQPALAALVREPDNPYDADAVAIWIDGRKVGHLSRSDAQAYQEPLLVLARQNRVLARDALICGHEDTPNLGVWLELPAVDDVLLAIS